MTIQLPDTPNDLQYEDFVAASLQAAGYFIETRLVLKEESNEILELDVVATPLGPEYEKRELFEAKHRKPSFSDLFKLAGQKNFLGLKRATLVTSDPIPEAAAKAYAVVSAKTNVHAITCSTADKRTPLAAQKNSLRPDEFEEVLSAAWFKQIAKRIAFADFVHRCKGRPLSKELEAARKYEVAINQAFFIPDPLQRAEALFGAYMSDPKLTGQLIDTLKGDKTKNWRAVTNDAAEPWIQYLMYRETTSRIALIKNALDDLVERGQAGIPTAKIKIGDFNIEIPSLELPRKYSAQIAKLKSHPLGLKLPYFFQAFVEICGGFIIKDDAEDLAFISRLTTIPEADIPTALKLFDDVFAADGSSMFFPVKDKLQCMKLVPGFIRGIGCFSRRTLFGISDYTEKYGACGFAMRAWHNAAYNLLEPTLKTSSKES